MQSISEDSSQGAVRREWPLPFSRTATPDWILWVAPFGRVGTEYPMDARSSRSGRLPLVASALERAGKRPPAMLRLWARAKAIPGEARLALNRLPTRCIRSYYLDRVLISEWINANLLRDETALFIDQGRRQIGATIEMEQTTRRRVLHIAFCLAQSVSDSRLVYRGKTGFGRFFRFFS